MVAVVLGVAEAGTLLGGVFCRLVLKIFEENSPRERKLFGWTTVKLRRNENDPNLIFISF